MKQIMTKIFTLPVLYVKTFMMILFGQALGTLILLFVQDALVAIDPVLAESDVWITGLQYGLFIGIWILMILCLAISKKSRPILKCTWIQTKGNNLVNLLMGLLLGFGLNAFCVLIAWLHKDIYLYFDSFRPLSFLLLFVLVFIQSSAEEVLCRGYLYQKLLKGYKHPTVAILGNSLLFALLHLGNEGVTLLSIINIVTVGILCSLFVYYMDSLWCAFGMHAAWNFTQNILFGLPNSGMVFPYSVFKLDASTATDSFAYNVGFGIEGTVMSTLILVLACVAMVLWGRKHGKKQSDIWETNSIEGQ
ncbi:MAG: CPBP family intramembrane metalloprotease [Lachnospiraceae bacterium]|nr:CPBP family intramembrane metalloprotease [Lachnospiraceae bacterium]